MANKRLIWHLKATNLLINEQFEFHRKHSTLITLEYFYLQDWVDRPTTKKPKGTVDRRENL